MTSTPSPPKLYTVREVAEFLRTNITTVYKWYHDGSIRLVKIGSLKCRAEDLQGFIDRAGEEI